MVIAALKPTVGHYKAPLWFKREALFRADSELLRRLEKAYM
jgi:hypothetical protein